MKGSLQAKRLQARAKEEVMHYVQDVCYGNNKVLSIFTPTSVAS